MRARTLIAFCGLVFLASTYAAAGPLEGRWLLVEETYGTGGLNLRRDKPPQTIELVREGGGLVARTRIGPQGSASRPWPAFVIGDTPARVSVNELSIAPAEDGVRHIARVIDEVPMPRAGVLITLSRLMSSSGLTMTER